MFCDDPEFRAIGGATRGRNPRAFHQGPVIDLLILGTKIAPVANHMPQWRRHDVSLTVKGIWGSWHSFRLNVWWKHSHKSRSSGHQARFLRRQNSIKADVVGKFEQDRLKVGVGFFLSELIAWPKIEVMRSRPKHGGFLFCSWSGKVHPFCIRDAKKNVGDRLGNNPRPSDPVHGPISPDASRRQGETIRLPARSPNLNAYEGFVCCRKRLGGLLRNYFRKAA
jgi:hypothetical protein